MPRLLQVGGGPGGWPDAEALVAGRCTPARHRPASLVDPALPRDRPAGEGRSEPRTVTRLASLEEDFYPILEAELASRSMPFHHQRISRRSIAGWPDYTIVAGDWLMFAELKAIGGEPTEAQWAWLHRLRGPWRASAVVAVDALDELLRIVDALKARRIEGPAGLAAGIVVLGSVKVPSAFAGGVLAGRGRPDASSAAGSPATRRRPRRPCTPRSRRGS